MTISVLLLSLFLCAPAALAQTAEPPQIIVTGEGTITATPNQARVSIGAESRSKTSKDAQQRNAEVMTAVQRKLAALGVPKDAIRTTAIDLQPEFDYTNGRQVARGYVARNTIDVRVDDFARIGDVIDVVVGSGATNIHGLRFDVKERAQLEAAALQAAVKDALAKAQAIATGAQKAIDRVLRIEEQFTGGGPAPMMRELAMAKADATPVAAGEIEIRAQVRVSVGIK
ncbi:MAG: SIMPL domain-containing protein [Acidimicrobiia bacterium]